MKYNLWLKLERYGISWFVQANDGNNKVNITVPFFFVCLSLFTSQVTPCIQKVFPFVELPKAYQMVMDGHLRGKVVVSLPSQK